LLEKPGLAISEIAGAGHQVCGSGEVIQLVSFTGKPCRRHPAARRRSFCVDRSRTECGLAQLKIMPARVTGASRALSSIASVIGAIVPAGARPSRLNSGMRLRQRAIGGQHAKTARCCRQTPLKQSIGNRSAAQPPATICGDRFVRSPANRPPASLLRAFAKGGPPGSRIDSIQILASPTALRPQARIVDQIPSGLLTAGKPPWRLRHVRAIAGRGL
jgi:hypothetical protein